VHVQFLAAGFSGATVARLVLDRPQRHNALARRHWAQLGQAVERLSTLPALRVVVVAGHGPSFCAGEDLQELPADDPRSVLGELEEVEGVLRRLEELPATVLGAAQGAVMGAGLQLWLASDVRLVTPRARLALPVAHWGLPLPAGFAARLVRVLGPSLARDLTLGGRVLTGEEAAALGLAHAAVPEDRLGTVATQWAQHMAAQSPSALRAAKEVLVRAEGGRGPEGTPLPLPQELQEGLTAFRQGRSPRYGGA
jgi:enoyl-CoA hydratase